jgi:hypothetical protein
VHSITYWTRVEPDVHTSAINETLAARVRDPLWLLTRQWQFGEFQGEDAAPPAFVQVSTQHTPFVGWRAVGQTTQSLSSGTPLEPLLEREPFPPSDLALQVELGQTFEALLTEAGGGDLVGDFRAAYVITPVSEDELVRWADQEAARFLTVCAGRAINGVRLYQEAERAAPALPALPPLDATRQAVVRSALERYRHWVQEVFGEPGVEDPATWRPERLEYDAEALAATASGGSAVLSVEAARDSDLDWHAFDLRALSNERVGSLPESAIVASGQSLLPTHVRFAGMPNARWWDFEDSAVDFGDVRPDLRDVARLMLIDMMLVHGTDWFFIPLSQQVGTLARIDTLVVHDVFGGLTLVERADRTPVAPGQRWTMFSTSVVTSSLTGGPAGLEGLDGPADFFLLPPSAGSAVQIGAALEEVRFFRDPLASMVWAVEHTTENRVGRPWPGHERDLASGSPTPSPTTPPEGADRPPLRYQIQSQVFENWIPFLAVSVDRGRGETALERGAMLRPAPNGDPVAIEPAGRILQPTSLGSTPYYLRPEAVPRSGVRVLRLPRRVRWSNGSTHVWIGRHTATGQGEGASGLHHDRALPTT